MIFKDASGRTVICAEDRREWRGWLEENYEAADEIWFAYPPKGSGQPSVPYNDSVEEALCFGWIDGMLDHYDETTYLRRFTPRRRDSPYSRLNIERLIWLDSQGMIHPKIREQVKSIIESEYIFPEDILDEIRRDPAAWSNYQSFPAPYRRVRIAHIDAARDRPDEFRRRLETFIAKTRANKLIDTYGCFDRYRRSASGEYDITCAVDTVRMKEILADVGLDSSRLSEILGYPESDVQRYLDLYEGGEPDSIPMGMRSLLDFVVNGSDVDREKVDLYILSNFSDQYERCGAVATLISIITITQPVNGTGGTTR